MKKRKEKGEIMVIFIEKVKAKKEKLMATAFVAFATAYFCIEEAFAETPAIFGTVETALEDIKDGFVGIASTVAALAAIFCLVMIFVSGERTASKYYGWLKRIAVAYIAVLAIGGIMTFFQSTFTMNS